MDNLENFIDNTVKISDYIEFADLFDNKNDKQPSFSVIVPCYNTGETIERTVASVLNQTLKNIEIIVVNDASTDEKTIKKLKKLEQYVKVIHLEKNSGVSNAKNIGTDNSHAQYILCLDSDDFIASSYLEKVKNIFDNDEHVGVVGAGVQNFGEAIGLWAQSEEFDLQDLLATNRLIAASCMRKSVYKDVGGYDTSLKSYEDWEFWIRVFSSEKKWKNRVIQETLFYYFVHDDSLQHGMSDAFMKNVLHIILGKHIQLYEQYYLEVFTNIHVQYTKNRLVNKKLTYNLNNANQQLKQKDQQLKQGDQQLKQKDQQIQQINVRLQDSNKKLINLQQSKSFRIGDLFFKSIKTPYKLIALPVNFVRILFS